MAELLMCAVYAGANESEESLPDGGRLLTTPRMTNCLAADGPFMAWNPTRK
jgi:hypothetical protein